jgi:hypothetical protein
MISMVMMARRRLALMELRAIKIFSRRKFNASKVVI